MGHEGGQTTRLSWMLNLQTGKVQGLPGNPESGNHQGEYHAELSPDGKYVLWQRFGQDGPAVVGNLSTGSFARISKSDQGHLLWSGNKVLLLELDHLIKTFDASGKLLSETRIEAEVLRGDSTGRRLLVWIRVKDPDDKDSKGKRTMAVITPEGNILKTIGSEDICPWGPWFSPQGNYAAIYYADPTDGWVTRLYSTETKDVITLTPHDYGGVLAITDTGEGIKLARKHDDKLEYWNHDGICRKLADHVIVATILKKEIFCIQRIGKDGSNSLVLKAVPFPQAAKAPTTVPSRGAKP